MKKLLKLLLIGLLALSSCTTDKDGPNPMPSGDTTLYMASGFVGDPEFIVNLDGDTVYLCEDEECRIQSLVAEGSDWYALIIKEDGNFYIVKNGLKILTGEGFVWCFTVNEGSIYSIVENSNHEVWAYKGYESQQDKGSWYFKQLFKVPDDRLYNTFLVHDGSIAMAILGSTPSISIDEATCPLDEYLDHGFCYVYGIDFYAGSWLITYDDYQTGKRMYWWKNINYKCPAYFQPITSCIVNGHAFILGTKSTIHGVGGLRGVPAVLIDGVETILSNDLIDFMAVSLASHGMDTYILVKDATNTSVIYKNLVPIKLPDIEMSDYYKKVFSWYQDGKMNLSEVGIKNIAVVEK